MLDLSLIDASITTLGDVLPFIRNRSSNGREPRPEDVRSLNLHSNVIRQLHASTLKLFSSLVILDLSSNLIEDIDGLKLVPTLEEVNLANNRIVRIGQLGGLYRLRKLVLSFNAIEDLAGIDGLAGDEYALEYLDIKGNKIRDIRCLQWLRDCVRLKHLVMSDDASFSKVNPICKDVAYSRVKVFQLLPHLRTLDMRDHMNKPCAVQVGSAGLRSYADFLGQKESQENSNPMSRFPTILTQPEDFSSKDHNRDELVARLSNLERQLNRMSGNTVPVSEITNRQPQTDLMRVMQMMEEIRSQTKSSKNGGEVKASIGSGDDRMDRIEKQMDNLITALSKPKAPSEVQKKVTGKQISQELRATDERPRTKALRNHVRREESRSEALESDIDETLSVESESESDYMCVPTKIIKPSGNRKHSLVWKADAEKSGRKASSEKKHPSTADAVTGKRSVALAANSKPDNAVTLAANAKLITALEAEERRLRENEKQYASQIKALTDEVAREKAERTRIAHQNEQLQLQLNDKQKLEEEVCNLRKENSVLTEKVEAADGLTQELVSVKKDLAQMQSQYEQAVGERKDLQQRLTENDHVLRQAAQHEEQVVKALTNVEQRLEHAEDDKARLSVRFMKEREQLKIKLAEVTKEKDIFKDTVRELQKELKTLQSSISSRDREMGSQMRDANTARTSDIKAAVSEATELMFARHQQELEALSKELTATRNAYAALEDEVRRNVKEEQAQYSKLQSAYSEIADRASEQAKRLEAAAAKEKEMALLIKELTSMLKEQKMKIAELVEREAATADVFGEKVAELESKVQNAQKFKQDMKHLVLEKAQKQAVIDELTIERQQLTAELSHQQANFEKDTEALRKQVIQLQEQLGTVDVERKSHHQALRVKNKMLDDQNQTIATLKQNLSNKSREYTALQLAVEKLESKLVGTNSEINDLQAELDSQAKLVEHLQSVADEYRDERDDLRVEIVEISRKLKEREKGLDAIEKEVEKMRGVWRAKEEKLLKEKEDAIKAQGFIGVELKERCEVQAIRLAAFEREREAMIQSLQRLQGEVDKAAQERVQHETELQMLKSEMDRQKQRMSEKMNKLKQAFADP